MLVKRKDRSGEARLESHTDKAPVEDVKISGIEQFESEAVSPRPASNSAPKLYDSHRANNGPLVAGLAASDKRQPTLVMARELENPGESQYQPSSKIKRATDGEPLGPPTRTLRSHSPAEGSLISEQQFVAQLDTRPLSQGQIVAEVKGIYAGLVMIEAKCIQVVLKQAAFARDAPPGSPPKLNNEQWQALTALHRFLLDEHHDFFLASQHPSASAFVRELAMKYAMPARLWRHGIHSFLELLRSGLPESRDHMLAFIYLSYSRITVLCEALSVFEVIWMECLGDLSRYRMAIENDDIRDREVWTQVARQWYLKASDLSPETGRLCHHLAILARPSPLQQLFLFTKALSVAFPFAAAKDSMVPFFQPFLESKQDRQLLPVIATYVKVHAFLCHTQFPNPSYQDQASIYPCPLSYEGECEGDERILTEAPIRMGSSNESEREESILTPASGKSEREWGECLMGASDNMSLHTQDDKKGGDKYSLAPPPGDQDSNTGDASDGDEFLLIRAFGNLSFGIKNDESFTTLLAEFTVHLNSHIDTGARLFWENGYHIAIVNCIALLGYGSASNAVFAEARLLFNRTTEIVLERVCYPKTLSYVYALLVFIAHVSPDIVDSLAKEFPWQSLALTLNTLLEIYQPHSRIEGDTMSIPEGGFLPMPEDFALRGLPWVDKYLPDQLFKGKDWDTKISPMSAAECRLERILWLGCQLAKTRRWISYNPEKHRFSVS